MLDRDGYPTEETLKAIKEWEPTDFMGLTEFIIENWWMEYGLRWTKRRVKAKYGNDYYKFCISTGGWSGNEDTIRALQEHPLYWAFCFYSHYRGGHYEFHIPIFKEETK